MFSLDRPNILDWLAKLLLALAEAAQTLLDNRINRTPYEADEAKEHIKERKLRQARFEHKQIKFEQKNKNTRDNMLLYDFETIHHSGACHVNAVAVSGVRPRELGKMGRVNSGTKDCRSE